MELHDWEILAWQRANSLMQQAERIHRNFLEVAVRSRYRALHNNGSAWEPRVNILENGDSVSIVAALPGVNRESVQMTLDGNLLTISGEQPLPSCCSEGSLKMWELPLGRLERRLRLGEGRGPLKIEHYSLRDGLLTIELRKNL